MARHVWRAAAVGFAALAAISAVNAQSADPDLIFRKSTTFKLLTPNDNLAVYGVDDPVVEGVACHYTAPERGAFPALSAWPNKRRMSRLLAVNMLRLNSRTNSPKAM